MADFKACPCFEMLRLWGGAPSTTWKEQERQAKARVARILGWARLGSSDAEALASLRGRGGRAKLLKSIVKRVEVDWDRVLSQDREVAACLGWVKHLRDERVRNPSGLRVHLARAGKIISPKDALDAAFGAVQVALSSHRHRLSQRLGQAVLAALWGLEGPEALKKRGLTKRRTVRVRAIKIDLIALERTRIRVHGR